MINIDKEIKLKIEKYISFNDKKSLVLNITNLFNLENLNSNIKLFINLGKINDIIRINKFHERVNLKLNNDDYYVTCSETLEERRKRIWLKAPSGFKYILRIVDFFFKRLIPKLPVFKKIYFSITNGNNRVMSKSEILGRLISCGFEIQDYFEYKNLLYVISKKIKKPDFNLNPSYGPLFKMNRIGYKGKMIVVYKLRTMYPFSEYLQEFIVKENKLLKSGKISDDYRLTTWGRIFRKFWIDELPMLINLIKRDLNLVGVRPLSKHYFSLYPKDLQQLRIEFKPGLIPPYYADMPNNFKEILDSEKIYLNKKNNAPIITDIVYFSKAVFNILFKGARSN